MAKTKTVDAASAGRLRLLVRLAPGRAPKGAIAPTRRYRAGLGPFTREPQVVEVEQWQAEALRGDPFLAVEEVDGAADAPAPAAKPAAARTRGKNGAETANG